MNCAVDAQIFAYTARDILDASKLLILTFYNRVYVLREKKALVESNNGETTSPALSRDRGWTCGHARVFSSHMQIIEKQRWLSTNVIVLSIRQFW